MTDTVIGVRWLISSVVSITDGDTVRVIRSRIVDVDGRRFYVTDVDPHGVPIRLTWLDTPERGQLGWGTARADLITWIDEHRAIGLEVICYGSAGWDRVLGDVRSAGESASQWMMQERGWLPYTG